MKEKVEIKSRCGIDCSECKFRKENSCDGCKNIKKPFWADICSVKECCESKKIEYCGKCENFSCDLLHTFAYDKENGDNGLRIENCKKWAQKKVVGGTQKDG